MLYTMHHGKIHRATVTQANLEYMGSITIDSELLELSGILPGERVQIVDNNNGNRLETYVIIIAYSLMTEEEAKTYVPKVVMVDENNHPINVRGTEKEAEIG